MEKVPTTLEDLKGLLEDTLEATEENNRLLKAIRRDALIGGIIKFIFWILIVVASFYFSAKLIEPYLSSFTGADSMNAEDFGALIEVYKNQMGQ